MTVTMADIAGDDAVNPDAQAAVTDFLDYTEYLPADLIRSLTLIRGLDETYLSSSYAVHDLTKVYGSLPSVSVTTRPDPQRLRAQISNHLDRALDARESAFAEACRLFDMTDRHQDRLKSIIAKLKALPKPPSRDPTPQPASSSAQKRSRNGRKFDIGTSTQRLTLKAPKGPIAAAILHRPKPHRVTVPGEVLPPYDPDDPVASTEVSDWESDPTSPIKPILKLKQPKLPKTMLVAEGTERKSREPREIVTYRKPTPPPEDAPFGSKYRPWTHLTEYEMYRLRKKMKKNHTWEPSDVMIRRELAEKGRGWDNYYKAKAAAQAKGSPFIDIESPEKSRSTPDGRNETSRSPVGLASSATPSAIRSKQSKRSDSRRDKRDDIVRDKASIAAQEAEQAARRLGDIGSAFRNLFSPFTSALASMNRSSSTPTANGSTNAGRKSEKTQKKRKIEQVDTASPSTEPENKKARIVSKHSPLPGREISAGPAQSAGTIRIPLKLNINTQTKTLSAVSTPLSTSREVSLRRTPSVAPKSEATPPAASRPPSRRSAAGSVEPGTLSSTRVNRRASLTPASHSLDSMSKTATTAAGRRSKREAPGTVTQSSQDGGAAVSVSKRKTKPPKQNKIAVQQVVAEAVVPQIRVDVDGNQELVDPDEERYCVCGDVSYGNMICCELDEKCEYGQWFHMDCVQLIELPPRTVKWFCPGDRKKYHKGGNSNGLVGRGIR